jgi:DNA-binding SARP family transcriptional activator
MEPATRSNDANDAGIAIAYLRLLGVPHLQRPDGSAHFLERLEAALLARLLLDGPAPRAAMAALMWPEVDSRRARGNLRQRLRRLKTAAGFNPLLDAEPLCVRSDLRHDLGLHGAPGDGAEDGHAELLSGLDFSDAAALSVWVTAARERIGVARRQALEQQAARHEAAGELAAALRLAHRLLESDPLDEGAHRRVMRLHQVRGDRAAALAAYHHCADVLRRELGARPGRDTEALAAGIEAGVVVRNVVLPPLALSRPPRLIGREREMAALAEGWRGGPIVAVLGEAGIGKSRLLAEFAATQPVAVISGARPGDAQVQFALLARLLRAVPGFHGAEMPPWVRLQLTHLLPELGPTQSPGLNPLRLGQALTWILANLPSMSQGALVVDDLQFADTATLELLPLLLQADVEPPLRWLLAARHAEMPALLAKTLDSREAPHVTVVAVGALETTAVQALLHSLALEGLDAAAWAPALHRHTGGNPMFILQTLLSVGAGSLGAAPPPIGALPLPNLVGELIERRLARCSEPARQLAQVAALAGQDFDARLAVAVLERPAAALADAWHELEQAQVLRDEAFAHDLVFEATLRSVPVAAVGAWRGRIAAHLSAVGGPLPRIAAHWQAAGQWALAARAYSDAARQIRRQQRTYEEVALLEQAAACHAAAQDAQGEVEDWNDLFMAQWRRKNRPGFREAAARLQALQGTSPRARMWALATAGRLGFDERQDEASLSVITQAREQAQALDNAEIIVWLSSVEAHCHALLNRPVQALRAGRYCLDAAEGQPPSTLGLGAIFNVGSALELCGHLAEAELALRRAEDEFRRWDDPVAVADTQCFLSICAHQLGRVDEAAELLTRGRQMLAEINGGTAEVHTPVIFQGRYWRDQGRLAQALALLEDGYARTVENGEINLHAGICTELGLTFIVLGQLHRVPALVDKPRNAPKVQVRMEGLLLEAELARAEGRSPMAFLTAAQELVPHCPRSERYGWRVQTDLSSHMEAGQAVVLLEEVVSQARERQTWSHEGPARIRLVEAYLRVGQTAAAAREARAMASMLEHRPTMTLCAGEYHWALVRAFDAAGDAAALDTWLRRAVANIANVARHSVPDNFIDSFLERNPFHRELRARASRHGV